MKGYKHFYSSQGFVPATFPLWPKRFPVIQPWRRLFDLSAALCGCLLLLFILPGLWLVNLLFSPGPLFYRQTRVGAQGQAYTMFKLRSMVVEAEKEGIVWTSQDDPRITVVGHFLRKTHVDELPQFWNNLRDEMSLIGPRPERPEFVELLTKEIEGYSKRHSVKPGITGWAQVNYGYTDSIEGTRIKLQYDLEYIKHQSLGLDTLILWRTFGVIWKGR